MLSHRSLPKVGSPLALALAFVAGCGSSPLLEAGATPPGTTARPDDVAVPGVALPVPDTRPGWLVWTRAADGRPITHRLDADGAEVASVDGVRLAVAGAEWELVTREVPVATTACGHADDPTADAPDDPAPGHGTRLVLRPVAGGPEQVVVAGPDLGEGVAELDHGVSLVATVGTLLFLHESTWAYACGAHGATGARAIVWDAARGRAIDLAGELGDLDATKRTASERMLASAADDGSPFLDEDEATGAPSVDLTEIVPRWDATRGLVVGLRMTTATCYACSDGAWSSYTTSVVVDASAPPRTLASAARLPEPVRAFAQHLVAGQTLGGFGATGATGAR